MSHTMPILRWVRRSAGVLGLLAGAGACYGGPPPGVPPAPIVFRWPEPSFDPHRQCRGGYAASDLAHYLPRASLALWLPNTENVEVDERGGGCLRVGVENVGTGRLVELLLRGVAVPRRAVLLELSHADRPSTRAR